MKKTILSLIAIAVFCGGCATNQKSRLATMGVAFVMGGIIGHAAAPDGDNKEPNALLGAGIATAGAGVFANYIYNDDEQLEKARIENDKLKAELALFQNSQKVLIEERSGEFRDPETGKRVPGRYSLKYFKVDRLQRVDKNKMIHVDREIEISPIESGN